MKTTHATLMEDPEFRKLLSVEALAAEASEVIASLMAQQNLSKDRFGEAIEQITRVGDPTAERESEYDGPYSGGSGVRARRGGRDSRTDAELEDVRRIACARGYAIQPGPGRQSPVAQHSQSRTETFSVRSRARLRD